MITRRFAIFWTPWWDVDHHHYGCPLEIIVHTRTWVAMVRPFSSYAGIGDDPSTKHRVELNTPANWYVLQTGRRYHWVKKCVVCLHDVDTCTMISAGRHACRPARIAIFPRHLLREHLIKRTCHGYREIDWVTVDEENE